MAVLFLDDDADRASAFLRQERGATWVTTAEECIAALSLHWNVVSLDHDLGGEVFVDSDREDCGMEVVRHIVGHASELAHLREARFIVHSYNYPAAHGMVAGLLEAGFRAVHRPFGTTPDDG